MRNLILGDIEPKTTLSELDFLDVYVKHFNAAKVLKHDEIISILNRRYDSPQFDRGVRQLSQLDKEHRIYGYICSAAAIFTYERDIDRLIANLDLFAVKLYHVLSLLDTLGIGNHKPILNKLAALQEHAKQNYRKNDSIRNDELDIAIVLLIGTYLKYNRVIDAFITVIETTTTRNLRKLATLL